MSVFLIFLDGVQYWEEGGGGAPEPEEQDLIRSLIRRPRPLEQHLNKVLEKELHTP